MTHPAPETTIQKQLSSGPASTWILGLLLFCGAALTACGKGNDDAPVLVMPDLVGKPISSAVVETYDVLHTSLGSFDLSPADRITDEKWVVAATRPAAGEPTPKFQRVYAWVLKASEYEWFVKNPTMPKVPDQADVEKLIGKGGLLEPVKDLVLIRYDPETAPRAALPSPVDKGVFVPDRGLHPDLAAEPIAEFETRTGLRAAPGRNTYAVDTRPPARNDLRVGQYLVLLVTKTPPKPPEPTPTVEATPAPSSSSGSSSGGSSGSNNQGPGSGLPSGFPTKIPKIPGCPKRLCG